MKEKRKIDTWYKVDGWDIYENEYDKGEGNIIVGEPVNGYLVFINKKGVKLRGKGLYFKGGSGYVDKYKTKKEALQQLKKIEKALSSNKTLVIPTKDKEAILSMYHTTDEKTKGAIIVYPKGDDVGLAHEIGHIEAGHSQYSKKPKGYTGELEAVRFEVKNLKKMGKWNKKTKDKVATMLTTYSTKPYQKKRRALRDIARIETQLSTLK